MFIIGINHGFNYSLKHNCPNKISFLSKLIFIVFFLGVIIFNLYMQHIFVKDAMMVEAWINDGKLRI